MTSKSVLADRTHREVMSSSLVASSPTTLELSAKESTASAQCLQKDQRNGVTMVTV
jgi:hypothetical protein